MEFYELPISFYGAIIGFILLVLGNAFTCRCDEGDKYAYLAMVGGFLCVISLLHLLYLGFRAVGVL